MSKNTSAGTMPVTVRNSTIDTAVKISFFEKLFELFIAVLLFLRKVSKDRGIFLSYINTSCNLILSNIFLLVNNLKKRNKVLFFRLVKLKNSASKCAEAVNNKTEQQKCAALPAKSKIFIAQRRRRRKMQYNFLKKPFSMEQKDDII